MMDDVVMRPPGYRLAVRLWRLGRYPGEAGAVLLAIRLTHRRGSPYQQELSSTEIQRHDLDQEMLIVQQHHRQDLQFH